MKTTDFYAGTSVISLSRIEDDAVPQTDSEVGDLVSKDFSAPVSEIFMKIYNARRHEGYSVLGAYMDTLQDYIRACKATMPVQATIS